MILLYQNYTNPTYLCDQWFLSVSPTYQLCKYLTNVLKPLSDESGRKLQSTENFIDAIKTIQIPDDHELVSFDVEMCLIK